MGCKYCGSEKWVRDGVCSSCANKLSRVKKLYKECQNLKKIIEEQMKSEGK